MTKENLTTSKKDFCKIYSEYFDTKIYHIDEIKPQLMNSRTLYDFSDFYSEKTMDFRTKIRSYFVTVLAFLLGAVAAIMISITIHSS